MSLMDKIKKNSTLPASQLDKSELLKTKDVITTSLPILNIALSGDVSGGFSSSVITLAAPSKHFKSLLALLMVKAYFDRYDDAVCIFYDCEFGITDATWKSFGIDPTRVMHIPVTSIEDLRNNMVNQLEGLEKNDHVIMMIDSMGNLASKKEMDNAREEKESQDMTRSKVAKGLWRIVTPWMTIKNVPCIAIQHTYQSMETYSQTIVSGGCLVEGTEIRMSDGTLRCIESVLVGDVVVTKDGNKEVTATWNPDTLYNGEPECFEITFEDGSSVVCSDEHKFLVDGVWVEAKLLAVGNGVELI